VNEYQREIAELNEKLVHNEHERLALRLRVDELELELEATETSNTARAADLVAQDEQNMLIERLQQEIDHLRESSITADAE
jgi:predicted nuclease with TOPRIM domain